MTEPLSDHEREATLRVARVMYPHDALPDEAYEKVVRAVAAEASGGEDVRATIAQGIAALDDPYRVRHQPAVRKDERAARGRRRQQVRPGPRRRDPDRTCGRGRP